MMTYGDDKVNNEDDFNLLKSETSIDEFMDCDGDSVMSAIWRLFRIVEEFIQNT